MWIGGYRKVTNENTWGWYDGATWSYTNWDSGEPNNANFGPEEENKENCVMVSLSKRWNDNRCKNMYSSICAYNPGNTLVTLL